MRYIGIGLARLRHSAAAVGDDGKRVVRGFDLPDRGDGFEALLRGPEAVGAAPGGSEVCLGAAGHHGRSLVASLEGHGYEAFGVNPPLTASWRRATGVRRVRNDAVGAGAPALRLLAGNPTARGRAKDESDGLRSPAGSRTSPSHMIGDCKRRAVAMLDVTFPEPHGFFPDGFCVAAGAVLPRWQSAEALSHARPGSTRKGVGGRRQALGGEGLRAGGPRALVRGHRERPARPPAEAASGADRLHPRPDGRARRGAGPHGRGLAGADGAGDRHGVRGC